MDEALVAGRRAFEQRAWQDAYDGLSAADRAGTLPLDDLKKLAISAFLVGDDQACAAVTARAQQECLQQRDAPRAARCAFWLAVGHLLVGEMAQAVPERLTFSIFEPGGMEGPIGRIPELALSSLAIATVALGIAEGALSEVSALATGKVPMFAETTLAANPLFRHRLGEADAHLRAAGAMLDAEIASIWTTAVAGDELTPEQRAKARSAATWATTAAAEVVDVAYTMGGGSSLYMTSPLQRRLRDIKALTQHFAVKPDVLTLAGAVIAGQDVDLSFLRPARTVRRRCRMPRRAR